MKFNHCTQCDQTYLTIIETDKQMICCNQPTTELVVNTIQDELEHHQVHIRVIGKFVTVSLDQDHPMVDVHHIDFICVETSNGFQYKTLEINGKPKAEFVLAKDEELQYVYVHCNVHSLWKFDRTGNQSQ